MMNRVRTGRRMLLAAIAGAAGMYYFDPDRGAGRRARLGEWTGSMLRHGAHRAVRGARHRVAEAAGRWQRQIHKHPYRAIDERTFLDHVETELFKDPEIPKGRLNLDVEKGVLVLRGQLETPEQIALVEERVLGIDGVEGIASYLHLPGTPAPNKASVRELTATARR